MQYANEVKITLDRIYNLNIAFLVDIKKRSMFKKLKIPLRWAFNRFKINCLKKKQGTQGPQMLSSLKSLTIQKQRRNGQKAKRDVVTEGVQLSNYRKSELLKNNVLLRLFSFFFVFLYTNYLYQFYNMLNSEFIISVSSIKKILSITLT